MPKPPQVSGRETVKALQRAGFQVLWQEGSHVQLRRENPYARVSVSNHRELKPGTLRQILKDADLTVEEFIKLL